VVIGTAAAERALQDGATGLVSFGLAGGLDPALRPGTLIIATHVVTDTATFPADAALSHHLAAGAAVRCGPVLGGTEVAATAAAKRQLWHATQAMAVDLESGAVAQAATRHGVPFAVLRAVCDPAERDLPPAALAALDHAGAIGLGRVLASLLRHPAQLPALLSLARDAAAARRALAAQVRRIFPPARE
jgi:adenosylhomocysteine nucleosidase